VGVDGTDKEINAAEYGAPPDGYNFLVIGHEGWAGRGRWTRGHRAQAWRLRGRDSAPSGYECLRPYRYIRHDDR
jgi:hypothetical protein